MLESWQKRAAEVKDQGWHWEYKVESIKVTHVETSDDGQRAIAEATLQESADYVRAIGASLPPPPCDPCTLFREPRGSRPMGGVAQMHPYDPFLLGHACS